MTNKTVAFSTLGCKLNFSESSWLSQQFENAGYERVAGNCPADVHVVNTCTVTELANKKSRQAIKKIINAKPDTIVVAVGCYTQLNPQEVANIEGVDIILGSNNKMNLVSIISSLTKHPEKPIVLVDNESSVFEPVYSFGDRTRSFFKVQDGCNYFCSYCAIPHARGRSRSNTLERTLDVAREIASKGVKEIVLTGVNIGEFGKTYNQTLFDLIRGIESIDGIERLRISSIEPNLLTDEIIEYVVNSKVVMPHFHIPLQCGTDELLQSMHRRYSTSFYAQRIEKIKQLMPDACIAADVIVGVPGETEELFNQSCNFVSNLPLSYLHVFPYSERANTLAARMPNQVPVAERHQRSQHMIALGEQLSKKFITSQLGKKRTVLFESKPFDEYMYGFTDNYIKIRTTANSSYINQIKQVEIIEQIDSNEAFGKIIEP